MQKCSESNKTKHFSRDIVARLHTGVNLPFSKSEESTLFRMAYEGKQINLPKILQRRVLHLRQYKKPSRHLGGRRLYHFLRGSFYWSSMCSDWYKTVRTCFTCTRIRVNLRRHNNFMKIFPILSPQEFVAIDILDKLVTTLWNKQVPLGYIRPFF